MNVYDLDEAVCELRILGSVPCGEPMLPSDEIHKIDCVRFVEVLCRNARKSYMVQAIGNSMINARIFDGDYVCVDTSIEARDGDRVLVAINGEVTLKFLHQPEDDVPPVFLPANPNYLPIHIGEYDSFHIFGVVTSSSTSFL